MRKFELDEFLKASGGILRSKKKSNFLGIGTDSRKDLTGFVFIPLRGENFDGHHFLNQAIEAGAIGLVVDQKFTSEHQELLNNWGDQVTLIEADDTLLALQRIGTYCRRQSQAKVIGITGSNGKTTSKEFASQLIRQYRKVHFSRGSFNNHWGVPFTLIQIPKDCEIVIVEMGMNHAGEIRDLVKIAEPDVVVCTMVGVAHIEFFGTIEKIAQAKEEIYIYSSPEATRVFNLDNEFTRKMQASAIERFPHSRQITVSASNQDADIFLKIIKLDIGQMSIEGSICGHSGKAKVPVFGGHNLTNLLVAAAVSIAIGLRPEEIFQGLEQCQTNWGRNQFVPLKSGAVALFDGYNANPDSMNVLLENIKSLSFKSTQPHRKIYGVFGQMLELGEWADRAHFELGQIVGGVGFDSIYFIGNSHSGESFKSGLQSIGYLNKLIISDSYNESLAKKLSSMLNKDDVVILKGSRGVKLEKVLIACEPINFNLNKESTI